MAILQYKEKEQWADEIPKLILIAGIAHSFEANRKEEEFLIAISTPVTADPGARLLGEIIGSKTLPASDLPSPISEVQHWEKIIRNLTAAEKVISDEMIAEEMLEFDFTVQMPPKTKDTLQVKIRSIRKAVLHYFDVEEV